MTDKTDKMTATEQETVWQALQDLNNRVTELEKLVQWWTNPDHAMSLGVPKEVFEGKDGSLVRNKDSNPRTFPAEAFPGLHADEKGVTVTLAPGWKWVEADNAMLDGLRAKGVIKGFTPEEIKAVSVAKAMREGVCRVCNKPTTGRTVVTDYGNEFAHVECLPEQPKVERIADNTSKGKY